MLVINWCDYFVQKKWLSSEDIDVIQEF